MKNTLKTCSKEISSFFLIVLITVTLTRIWSVSLFYIFGYNSEFTQKFVNDSLHHYQVGLLLLPMSYLLRKIFKPGLLLGIGLGIFLEEWPVFLNDIGFNTNGLYHTTFDFILIFGFIGLIYILFSVIAKKHKEDSEALSSPSYRTKIARARSEKKTLSLKSVKKTLGV